MCTNNCILLVITKRFPLKVPSKDVREELYWFFYLFEPPSNLNCRGTCTGNYTAVTVLIRPAMKPYIATSNHAKGRLQIEISHREIHDIRINSKQLTNANYLATFASVTIRESQGGEGCTTHAIAAMHNVFFFTGSFDLLHGANLKNACMEFIFVGFQKTPAIFHCTQQSCTIQT